MHPLTIHSVSAAHRATLHHDCGMWAVRHHGLRVSFNLSTRWSQPPLRPLSSRPAMADSSDDDGGRSIGGTPSLLEDGLRKIVAVEDTGRRGKAPAVRYNSPFELHFGTVNRAVGVEGEPGTHPPRKSHARHTHPTKLPPLSREPSREHQLNPIPGPHSPLTRPSHCITTLRCLPRSVPAQTPPHTCACTPSSSHRPSPRARLTVTVSHPTERPPTPLIRLAVPRSHRKTTHPTDPACCLQAVCAHHVPAPLHARLTSSNSCGRQR